MWKPKSIADEDQLQAAIKDTQRTVKEFTRKLGELPGAGEPREIDTTLVDFSWVEERLRNIRSGCVHINASPRLLFFPTWMHNPDMLVCVDCLGIIANNATQEMEHTCDRCLHHVGSDKHMYGFTAQIRQCIVVTGGICDKCNAEVMRGIN